MPGMSDRRSVRISLHLERELLSAARPELDGHQRRVEWRGLTAGGHAEQLMFPVAAALHDHRARLRRVEVDQGDDRARIRQFRHERRHVVRHAGAFSIGIEVAQASVQEAAFAAGKERAERP